MAKRKPARSKARPGATAASARRPARGRATARRTSTRATSTTRTATRPAAKPTSSRRAAPKPKASTTSTTRATSRPSKPAAPKPAARKATARPSPAKSPRRAAAAPARATSTAGWTAEPRRSGAGGRSSQGSLRRQIARDRRLIQEEVPTPPSSLDLDRRPSAARAGRAELEEALAEHTAAGPGITGGDVDAEWQSAYTVGDTAPGGDMPTPDQDVVEEIGNAVGLSYKDDEELKGAGKVEERDRHRWELDPASSEDYPDRTRRKT